MLHGIQEGDIIYVTDLTRITRSTKDLFELIDNIRSKKANLISLKDTWLDLSEDNPYIQFLITVMAGVNRLERDFIRMRQREGIELAKKEGKLKGRSKKYHKNHAGMNYAVKLYNEGDMTVNKKLMKLQMCLGLIIQKAIGKEQLMSYTKDRKYIIENKFHIEVKLYA